MRVIINNNEELSLFQEEFDEFLQEEQILNEGKILNKIRWKLALFSLRFLKESSLDDFLIAYYADNNGKPTEKSKEWVAKSKKEKRKKMRELANQLSDEQKEKICNSQAAVNAEKQAVGSFVGAGAAGAAGAAATINLNKTIKSDTSVESIKTPAEYGKNDYIESQPQNDPNIEKESILKFKSYGENGKQYVKDSAGKLIPINPEDQTIVVDGEKYQTGNIPASERIEASTITKFTALAPVIFGAMWGGLVLAGVGVGRGVKKLHQANVMRRDEIIAELRKKRDLEEAYTDFELYRILDENGYSTDSESLQILKEGIVSGDFIID